MKKVKIAKIRIPRGIKRTMASAGVLLVLVIIAGLVYVYFFGRGNDQSATAALANSTPPARAVVPSKPAANAREGVAVTVLNSPVAPGDETSIGVQTLPGSKCDISVEYNHIKVQASGLVTKIADDFGNVDWGWMVAKTAPIGTWPVTVTCYYHKNSAVVIGNLEISQSKPQP